MLEIYIGNAFEPTKVIANTNKSIREIYNENGVAIPTGSIVTWGTRCLGDAELDEPLSSLGNVSSNDLITFTQKLNGAH